jgi:starch synthase (maltosyl-transferring)
MHSSENDGVLAFSKRDPDSDDTILVICSTDPHQVREGWIHLKLDDLGVGWDESFMVSDLLSGENYLWGEHNFVRLSPDQPAHIFAVHRRS